MVKRDKYRGCVFLAVFLAVKRGKYWGSVLLAVFLDGGPRQRPVSAPHDPLLIDLTSIRAPKINGEFGETSWHEDS